MYWQVIQSYYSIGTSLTARWTFFFFVFLNCLKCHSNSVRTKCGESFLANSYFIRYLFKRFLLNSVPKEKNANTWRILKVTVGNDGFGADIGWILTSRWVYDGLGNSIHQIQMHTHTHTGANTIRCNQLRLSRVATRRKINWKWKPLISLLCCFVVFFSLLLLLK